MSLYKAASWEICSYRQLQSIPSNIDSDTVVLDLSHYSLSKIRNNSFIKLALLEQLNVSSNHISMLENSAFHGLSQLTVLKLTANKLPISKEIFQPDLFKPLKNLRELYLDDNLVMENSTYLDETIGRCSKLEVLHIPGLYNKTLGPGYSNLMSLTT